MHHHPVPQGKMGHVLVHNVKHLPHRLNTIAELKDLLISYYASSAFNRCTRKPLPRMKGEPMPIFTDDGATPVAAHIPINVHAHWTERVKADLDRDVALGIIEPVPLNTESTWCARMVVVP